MATNPFDPCRQWLGIDAVDLGDPHRVLGISPAEFDRQAVLRAAESRLAKLRGVPAGPFGRARDALIARVEEARETVLAQIAARTTATLSMPPPPGHAASRPTSAAVPPPMVPRVPAAPTVPRPSAAVAEWPDQAGHDQSSMPVVRVGSQANYRRRSGGSGMLVALIVALAAAAGGLAWYKFRPDAGGRKAVPREVARVEPAPPDPVPVVRPTPVGQPAPEKPARRPRPRPDRERDAETPPSPSTPDPVAPPVTPDPTPPPAAPDPAPPSPAPVPPTAPETPDPPADRPPAMQPAPSPAPDAPMDEGPRLQEALREVATALREARYDAAAAGAAAATNAAMTADGRARAERWAELVTFARGFADYREQALATVQAGTDFDVDGKKIAVVEIDEQKFVFRFAGKNRTVPRDKIPGGIVMAIVEGWFDETPANDLFIGAYHATKEEPDLDKARAAWERARSRGADASLLLPLLDDPLLAPAL